jgi:hypothetical protein
VWVDKHFQYVSERFDESEAEYIPHDADADLNGTPDGHVVEFPTGVG